jgi:tetratricopeptide (TPR) repeat protein
MAKSANDLQAEARQLKQAGRLADAIALYEAAVALEPANTFARHNLAAALGDAGRWVEAEAQLRAGFAAGLNAGESWLVLARSLEAQRRMDEALQAYRTAIARKATLYDAHRELAQLAWMTGGDSRRAVADLDVAVRNAPRDAMLRILLSQALEYSGRPDEAYRVIGELRRIAPTDGSIAGMAAHSAIGLGHIAEAVQHGAEAARLAPQEVFAVLSHTAALLAAGRPVEAAAPAIHAVRMQPNNQAAIAYLATAWRMSGNPQYRQLYDYEALVTTAIIAPPPGWASLEHYLADLAAALRDIHVFREHPFNQSLRHGSQVQNILQHDHPAIRALPGALDAPIRGYISRLGRAPDPVRARNAGGYQIQGIWSVLLHPDGYHTDHMHPEGWISSAFYVEPVDRPGHEGWIRFGQPGSATSPALEAEHYVKPEPGMLVLFPSYMWHGTVPFGGDQTRLTCAFDLIPTA